MTFDHLLKHESDTPVEKETLETLAEYSNELVLLRDEVSALERALKDKKKQLTKYEQDLIPSAMLALGLMEIKLTSGHQLFIKEELSCSVKNYEKLYDFLEARGDDALMKTSIDLDKLPQNILNRIIKDLKEQYDIDGTAKLNIHPQTLKAYFKRLCGIGSNEDAQVPLAAIDEDMLSTYTYYKVGIKK